MPIYEKRDPKSYFGKHHADALAERRRLSGMTQQKVADLAGITQGMYSKIETGEKRPTNKVLGKIARAFRCSAADLMPRVTQQWRNGQIVHSFAPAEYAMQTDEWKEGSD